MDKEKLEKWLKKIAENKKQMDEIADLGRINLRVLSDNYVQLSGDVEEITELLKLPYTIEKCDSNNGIPPYLRFCFNYEGVSFCGIRFLESQEVEHAG